MVVIDPLASLRPATFSRILKGSPPDGKFEPAS